MENIIPQDQVPNLHKRIGRFKKVSSRKVKRALNSNKSPKFLTIINNLN